MRTIPTLIPICLALWPIPGRGAPVAYSFTVTTAYAAGDPFPDRIDSAFVEPDTGYVQIANTGDAAFTGVIGTIAQSAFAGDLSFASDPLTLAAGASVSIAIPDDSRNVGGFNGPAYFYRPGVEIYLDGTVSYGTASQAVGLTVSDADIQSGVWLTDPRGLATDSFVLQGGDPWGFDSGAAFALSQSDGAFVFSQTVPEPASLLLLATGLGVLGLTRRVSRDS